MKIRFGMLGFWVVTLIAGVGPLQAQTTQTDFDGDSLSDYALVEIDANKKINWKYAQNPSGTVTNLGILGESGNHLILAPWKGLSTPQIGIVGLDSSGKTIIWRIVNENAVVEERQLGSKNHTALSGADFNGNGTSDAATAQLRKKTVEWKVSYDMFTRGVGQESPATINFGSAGDRIFYASPDGVSDWLGTIGASGKKSVVRLKSLITGEVRSESRFQRLLSKDPRPRPFPVKQENGIDALGFAVTSGKNTKIYFYDLAGTEIVTGELPGNGDIVVGNYTSAPGEEVAIKTTQGFTVYNPFDRSIAEISSPTGIAVDHININTVVGAGDGGNGGGNGGGDDDDDDTDGGPSSIAACKSIASWPGSHIYKTIGSNHFTDVRRNTAGIIIKVGGRGPFPGCIQVVDKSGKVLANMGLYATGAGWAARYYAGIGCGSSTPFNGSTLANKARANTGSTSIYANFGSVCYGPIDATRCIGSAQC